MKTLDKCYICKNYYNPRGAHGYRIDVCQQRGVATHIIKLKSCPQTDNDLTEGGQNDS